MRIGIYFPRIVLVYCLVYIEKIISISFLIRNATQRETRSRDSILSSIEFYSKNSTVGFESFVKFIHLFLIERSIHFYFHSINKNNNDNYILFHYYILQFSLFHNFFIELDVFIPEWAKPQTYTIWLMIIR